MSAFGFLKKIAPIVLGAALIYFAPPLALSAGFAGASLTTVNAIYAGLLIAGASTALSGVGGLIAGSPNTAQTLGARLTLRADPLAPRIIAYGKAATAGTLVFRETVGSDNEDLWMVIALAGHEIQSIEKFTWGGTTITFSSNNAVGTLNDLMFRYDKLGLDAQTVETNLDSASSKWTSAHRLRGIAYIVLKLVFDQTDNNQIKNPVCTIKGRRLYDPRLDSTNGGSGSHRLADHSTWEWSDNPALCIADYLIGIRVANSSTTSYDGQIIAGMGIASTRIDWANIRAEADSCDESVTLDAGGSESRYTCNGLIDPRNSHRENLEALASSMGGTAVYQGGKWRIYAAVSRAVVNTRGTDDILGDIKVRKFKSRDEKANAVRGIYADVNAEFQPRDIIPLINSAYVTEDGGGELWMDVNLPMTTSGPMAQRLAKIALERNRREIVVTANFLPVALQDQAMDSITFNHPNLGLSSLKMRVADWQMGVVPDDEGNPLVVFPMVLEEEADAVYDWDETVDEQAIPASVAVTRVERLTDQRANPSVNTAGAMVTTAANPLTASEVISNTKINIAAWSYQFGHGTVSWNVGQITGLAYSTEFFVYLDDPRLEGGAQTYVATTTKINITANVGRIYVGKITTPAASAGDTSGSGGGGQEP